MGGNCSDMQEPVTAMVVKVAKEAHMTMSDLKYNVVVLLAIDDFTFEVWRNFSACTDRLATPTGGQKQLVFPILLSQSSQFKAILRHSQI